MNKKLLTDLFKGVYLFQLEQTPMRRITPDAAKVELKKRGHSVRSAAPLVGRSYQWISQVLNGRATSRPVLNAIFDLPVCERKGKA